MESPVAAVRPPPVGWKEPAMSSPLQKPHLSLANASSSTTTSGSSNANNNNGGGGGIPGSAAVKTIPRSDANPYPTTFVQADSSSFKQVVQMLTGSSETAAKHAAAASSPRPTPTAAAAAAASASDLVSPRPPHPPPLQQHPQLHCYPPTAAAAPPPPSSIKASAIPTGPKRPAFKLYERRHNSFKNLRINPLVPGLFNGVLVSQGSGSSASSTPNSPSVSRTPTNTGFSPRYKPEILSPSILDFPSLALSPVTPLSPDPFNRPPTTSASSTPQSSSSAEDRAIAEKGFYLHPSPRSCLGADPPRLLPLFPVTSPRVAPAAAASASSGASDS